MAMLQEVRRRSGQALPSAVPEVSLWTPNVGQKIHLLASAAYETLSERLQLVERSRDGKNVMDQHERAQALVWLTHQGKFQALLDKLEPHKESRIVAVEVVAAPFQAAGKMFIPFCFEGEKDGEGKLTVDPHQLCTTHFKRPAGADAQVPVRTVDAADRESEERP